MLCGRQSTYEQYSSVDFPTSTARASNTIAKDLSSTSGFAEAIPDQFPHNRIMPGLPNCDVTDITQSIFLVGADD